MKLKSKVAMITGGSTGIGLATAELFADEGANLVITGLKQAELDQVAESITAKGVEVLAIEQDVTQAEVWPVVMDKVMSRFGRLDIMVNNAGIAIFANVEETTIEQWQKTQAVNSDGVFLGTQAAIKAMKVNDGGSIINISSIEGIIGEPNAAAYNASKGAVRIFSKSAALHCAKSGYNIRINTLHPGLVETPMTTTNVVEQMGQEDAEKMAAEVFSKVPMGRAAAAREMATAILFLASDDSSYMTGSELVVDGGYTAQ